MRLTREKTVRLSHRIIDFLVSSPDVDFVEDRHHPPGNRHHYYRVAESRSPGGHRSPRQNRLAEKRNPRRQRRVGHPLPQILRRGPETHGRSRSPNPLNTVILATPAKKSARQKNRAPDVKTFNCQL